MRANYFTARGDSHTISYLNAYLSLLAIPNESKLLEVSGMNTNVVNICIECSSHLESAYIFRQLCNDVNEMLKTQNDKMQNQNKLLTKVETTVAKPPPAVVDDAETTFTATMKIISQVKVESDYEVHNVDYQESTNQPTDSIACGKCDSRFKTVSGLNKHIIRTHQNDSYAQPAVEDTSYLSMMARLSSSPKKPTAAQCNSCARIFRTDSGLARHMVRKHSNVAVYRTFAANLSGQLGGKFVCDACDKAFHHLSTLKLHREKHSAEKFQCPLCAAKYKHSFNLTTHLTKKHKIVKSQ
jgi:uncharacterized C2H2 Zn-finger protein